MLRPTSSTGRSNRLSDTLTWAVLLAALFGLGALCRSLDVGLWPCVYYYPHSDESGTARPLAKIGEGWEGKGTATEAYVTFLASSRGDEVGEEDDGYFTSVRMLLHALRSDPYTRDPATAPIPTGGRGRGVTRDMVVLAQTGVSPAHTRQLEREGARVISVPPLSVPAQTQAQGGVTRWRDTLSKLHAFNLTQYTRVLLLDADLWVVRPIHGIWGEGRRKQERGEGKGPLALGDGHSRRLHRIPLPNDPPFNSGFMLLRPSAGVFDELRRFAREGEWDRAWMDQGLLNRFFDADGPNPWRPMDHMWLSNFPTTRDLDFGVSILHEKMWQYHGDRLLTQAWDAQKRRMEQYWARVS